MKGITTYSKKIPGTHRNFHWPVEFDKTDGCVGITQADPASAKWDRVLLSPGQVKALVDFLRVKKAGLLRRPK